eukprot:COSAG02_NODE_19855_length_861_cov_1.417323_1_plen_65_part_00
MMVRVLSAGRRGTIIFSMACAAECMIVDTFIAWRNGVARAVASKAARAAERPAAARASATRCMR